MSEYLPNRASDAGPDSPTSPHEDDWRDNSDDENEE